MADSGHPPAELHERLLICRTIKLNAGAHGGHRRCCHAQIQKNAQNKPQIARLILCVHTTLQFYCNLFLTFCQKLFDSFEHVVRFSTYPYWFFRFASAAFRSHSFRRSLALKYNTTSPAFCQHFFASFLSFFYISQKECFRAGFAPSLERCFPYLYYKRRKSPAVNLTAGDFLRFLLTVPVSSDAGSILLPQQAWAAQRSSRWAWDQAHYNMHLPG